MQSIVPRHDKPAAIRTDLGAIFVSLELSRSIWLVTSLSPGSGERRSKHAVPGGDIAGLLRRLFELKEKARRRMRKDFPIVVIGRRGWPRSTFGPATGDLVLLSDPGFVGEPDLYRGRLDTLVLRDLAQDGGETFMGWPAPLPGSVG